MAIYITKNKRIDAIKDFFIRNRKTLIIDLIIGIFTIVFWNYWKLCQDYRLKESAQDFEYVCSQLKTGSKKALILGEQFSNKTKNIYGVLTSIELAKILVEKSDISGAEKLLINALAIAEPDDLKDLINIRLARLQLALHKTDQAIITLIHVKNEGWSSIIEDIRGDILLKKGDVTGARAAYSKGIESSGPETMKTVLKVKMNILPN